MSALSDRTPTVAVVRRVDIGGRSVEIPVRVSRRARKLSIHVDAQRSIEIVVPTRSDASRRRRIALRASRVARATAREAAEGLSSRTAT
jgi:predicted metal-dependent hydrolase